MVKMLDVTLITNHTKQQLIWHLEFNEVLAAELTADIHGAAAILHNRVYLWNKSLCRAYLHSYSRIRTELAAHGIQLIMVCSDRYTEKMGHYWRLMGFKIFYDVPGPDFKKIPCAVMGV